MTETKCVLVGHRHSQNSDSDCFGWQRAESKAMRFILEWTCVVVLPHGPLTHMRTSWTAHASRCLICSFGYALLLHMLIAKNFMIEGRIPLFGTMLGSAAQSGPHLGVVCSQRNVYAVKSGKKTLRRNHAAITLHSTHTSPHTSRQPAWLALGAPPIPGYAAVGENGGCACFLEVELVQNQGPTEVQMSPIVCMRLESAGAWA